MMDEQAATASKHDPSLQLSAGEVVELTERVLEAKSPLTDPDDRLMTLEAWLRAIEPEDVPGPIIAEAVDAVLRDRAQRLSSVIARKAHELERMLFGLLPRLDASFRSVVPLRFPGEGAQDASIHYGLRAARGRLDVRVVHEESSVRRDLFTITVRSSRAPTFWERLWGERHALPREVTVRSPTFAGRTLEDLLTWTLQRKNSATELGTACAFGIENLRAAVLGEIDSAVRFVSELSFGAEDG